MSHIEFDEGYLKVLYDKSNELAETVSQSLGDLRTVESSVEQEFSTALAEISVEISDVISQLDRAHRAKVSVEQKIEATQDKIRTMPDIPSPPSDPQAQQKYAGERARAEQERRNIESENAKCQEEIVKSESIKRQLEEAISELDRCLQELRTAQTSLSVAQSNFNSIRVHNTGVFQKDVNDIGLFCNALNDTCSNADEVLRVKTNYGFDPWTFSGHFNVNSSAYTSGSSGRAKRESLSINFSAGDDSDADCGRRVLIIKEKQRDKVFELIARERGLLTIKIPAANLYALGGQGFIDEMEHKAFRLIKKDVSIIGGDGYITWEN